MIIGLNITFIALLLIVFYQDVKDREVSLMLFLGLLLLGGFLHSQFQLMEVFLLNVIINVAVVSSIVLILFLYTRFVMKKRLFETFGLGDLLFFLILAVSFPIPTFLVVFSCSLLFSFVISMLLKGSMKDKTIPLAGLQALFVLLMITSNLLFEFTNLYRI